MTCPTLGCEFEPDHPGICSNAYDNPHEIHAALLSRNRSRGVSEETADTEALLKSIDDGYDLTYTEAVRLAAALRSSEESRVKAEGERDAAQADCRRRMEQRNIAEQALEAEQASHAMQDDRVLHLRAQLEAATTRNALLGKDFAAHLSSLREQVQALSKSQRNQSSYDEGWDDAIQGVLSVFDSRPSTQP